MGKSGAFLLISFLLFILVSFTPAQDVEDNFGARPLGMGRAFVGIADDGNAALWNPAGMSFYKERYLTGMFSRLYWGIDNDAVGEGQLGYVHHFRKTGSVGINAVMLFSNIWQETRLTLSYSHNIGQHFSVGLNGRLLRNEIIESNITFPDDVPVGGDIVHPHNDPTFAGDNWSKIGFTGDVGVMYRPNRKMAFGLMVANLTEPDMSLEDINDNTQEFRSIRVGGSYWFRDDILPAMDIQYVMHKVNGGNQIHHYNGVEWWLSGKTIALRTGYNGCIDGPDGYDPTELAFGFTYRSKKALDLQVDYAFIYPLSEVREAGAQSHKLSASLRFLPPPEKLSDLALTSEKMDVYPHDAQIGEKVTVSAKIENTGEQPIDEYSVSLYYEHPEQGWVRAAPPIHVRDKLAVGEEKEIEFTWTAPDRGHYQLFASVDDDGTMLPALHGEIDELDETNNTGAVEVDVFNLPKGDVAPADNRLNISQVTLIREEEPVVPVFFFAPSSDRVPERFHRVQEILGARLRENPDIDINLYGYYDVESDGVTRAFGDRLALNRSKAVRSVFMRFEQIATERIHVKDPLSYDANRPHAGVPLEHQPGDVPMAMDENRRVEMTTFVRGFENWKPAIYFNKGSDKVNISDLSEITARAEEIRSVMERNPEVTLHIEGYASKDEVANTMQWVKLSFDRAYNIEQKLGEVLGEDFAQKFNRRIFIRGNTDEYADRGKAIISIDGEGLIYRPLEGRMTAKGYEVTEDRANFVGITTDVEAGVDTYTVSIIDEDGNTFRTLTAGHGDVPMGVPWDWKDETGNLIDPTKEYYCKLEIRDRLGQSFTTLSDPIKVEISKRQQQLETLVIVEFAFDEKISESGFLESRVEYVARRFIEKALEPKNRLTAVVSGHTDVIGMPHRNRQLSKERARKEEENLRRYLIYLLGLSNNDELNTWLRAHNTTLTSKGYSDTQPYVITKWDPSDGELVEETIGNNKLPEGRTINRRVVIEFIMEKEGTKREEVPPQSMAE